MSILTERQAQAIAGNYYMRGGRIFKYASKREFGTDAYIAWEAKTLALNPYRMPSECVLLLDQGGNDFLMEMDKVWKEIAKNGTAYYAETSAEVEAAIRARYAK